MGNVNMGFDCRLWGARHEALWDATRKSAFLLNPAIAHPLSVDQMSWPSIFDTGGPRRELGLDGIILPEFIGPHAPFWAELSELEAELVKNDVDAQQSKIIQALRCSEAPSEKNATNIHFGFVHLGFDVADIGFVSALTNCGLTEAEMHSLREQFRDALNEHHLFVHWESAAQYSAIVSDLIPEHAPFQPYLLAWQDSKQRGQESM